MGLKYEPSLDGLRAIAVISVVTAHCVSDAFPGGALGVDIFFVLSGYLITSLLRAELGRSDRIDYLAFIVRRMRRLYPALLLMLGAFVLVAPWLWPGHQIEALPAGLYLSNIWTHQTPAYLNHTWSLALEFQFYLLWPLILPLIARSGRPIAILSALWLTLTALRVLLPIDTGYRLHASGLMLGALITFLPSIPGRYAAIGGTLTLIAMTTLGRLPEAYYAGISLAEVGAAILVASAPLSGPALRWPPLVWVGKMSYAVYLWHFPMVTALRQTDMQHFWILVIVLPASLLLAWVSWLGVERPVARYSMPFSRKWLPASKLPEDGAISSRVIGAELRQKPPTMNMN